MLNESQIRRLAFGSKQYDCEDAINIMTIRGYYESDLMIKIDLSKLTPEMLEELAPDEDDWDEADWD